MPDLRGLSKLVSVLTALASCAPAIGASSAEVIYRHGVIYTADAKDTVADSMAVANGRIVYVGSEAGSRAFAGQATRIVDLKGKTLMPGLIDGHLHPLGGGSALKKCTLGYERLTKAAVVERISACLARTKDQEPDGWLEVVAWFQEGALPAGTEFTAADLDALPTRRPVQVLSSFGHTLLLNRRGLAVAGISRATVAPPGGHIVVDANGEPTGLLEDKAYEPVQALLPKSSAADDVASIEAALAALNKQGVTSFFDAWAQPTNLAAFATVLKQGKLTARAHLAPEVSPAEAADPDKAIARIRALARTYDGGEPTPRPGLTVRNAKFFLDGVINAPALSGVLLAPYFVNAGTEAAPRWVPGTSNGPPIYFPEPALTHMVLGLAAEGIEAHMHADGDGAVRAALDAFAALRAKYPGSAIRAAIAHDELVDPSDYPRFAKLDVIPVLSLQWGKPAADTIDGVRDVLGPERAARVEPSGVLAAAGARIAFGSDWPVDPLDEWYALSVGETREAGARADPKFPKRLGTGPALSRLQVLRAITINAAYELHDESRFGSLEVGKFADFIVLDRNVLTVSAAELAATKVLSTVVGGQTVYTAAP